MSDFAARFIDYTVSVERTKDAGLASLLCYNNRVKTSTINENA